MRSLALKVVPLAALTMLAGVVTGAACFASAKDPLFETVAALDAEVFAAFNNCSAAGQLEKHAGYFAPDVEFYHDTGGVTWTREQMIANTEKNVCGHFRRELVPGSLRIFSVKDFGAIELGSHRFCQFKTGDCEGLADFVIVWRNQGGDWKITRVLSYGHRANKRVRN
jgi:hypothetical protein